jgi:hypothetical protein
MRFRCSKSRADRRGKRLMQVRLRMSFVRSRTLAVLRRIIGEHRVIG